MLLIVFLGLIAKLVLVCDGCYLGIATLNDFDWIKFTVNRTWYIKFHPDITLVNSLDCQKVTVGYPVSGVSSVNIDLYYLSLQLSLSGTGTATNWNSSGYFQASNSLFSWRGHVCIIATDYISYLICKICDTFSSQLVYYVAYSSPQPDITTVNVATTELQKNNIDVSQLLESPNDHC